MFILDPGSWFFIHSGSRISDPTTAWKEEGENYFVSYHFL
jgi:hypothetical protein